MARIIIEKDIEIPMRDGCVLKGDLYRPDSNEKLPVLLNRTPYDKKFPLISSLTLDLPSDFEFRSGRQALVVSGRKTASPPLFASAEASHRVSDGLQSRQVV